MGRREDAPRLSCTTREEVELRQALIHGDITLATFNRKYKLLQKNGLIKRNGRVFR